MTKKYKSQNRDTLKSPWLMPCGTLIENYPFLENLSSHNPFLLIKMVSAILWTIISFFADINGTLFSHTLSLDRNDVNNPWTKRRPLFKIILTWGVGLQSGRSSMACVVAWSWRIMRTKKRRKKKNWLSCHTLEKFDWVQKKIKKAKFKKMCWKNEKLQSFSLTRIRSSV